MKYKELNVLANNLQAVITNEETKIQKKLVKIFEKVKPIVEEFQEKANDLRIDHASVDEKDILLLDEKGGYKFTKDGLKALTKQLQDLDNQEFEFTKINVVNPQGLEKFIFLKDWLSGVNFLEEEDEEL
jgi:hypothetical protein